MILVVHVFVFVFVHYINEVIKKMVMTIFMKRGGELMTLMIRIFDIIIPRSFHWTLMIGE